MNYNKWKKFKHIKLKPNNLDDMVTKNFANKINHLPKEVRAYSIVQLYKSPSGFIIKHYLLGMLANDIHPELRKIVKLWKIPKSEMFRYVHELIEEGMIEQPQNYTKSEAPKVFNTINFYYRLNLLQKLKNKSKIVELVKKYIRTGIKYNDAKFCCKNCGNFPSEAEIESVIVEYDKDGNVSFNLGPCKDLIIVK